MERLDQNSHTNYHSRAFYYAFLLLSTMSANDPNIDEKLKKQISQYAISEDLGVSLLTQMLEFVPGAEERKFLEGQIEDEKKHNRLFSQRADELGVEEKFFQDSLEKLYAFGQECVDKKDWLLCVACQSVIEELAFASFTAFYKRADAKTRGFLTEVMEDEKRHLEFALWQIGKWNKTDADKEKILNLQHKVLEIFMDALHPDRLNRLFTRDDQQYFKQILKTTYAIHKERFKKLKLEVPEIPVKFLANLM